MLCMRSQTSHGIENFDPGICRPRRASFVFSSTWDLPFGHGHRYLSTGVPAAILGGWEVSGIWTAQDGPPSPWTWLLTMRTWATKTGHP
jgi:hypothetical protein